MYFLLHSLVYKIGNDVCAESKALQLNLTSKNVSFTAPLSWTEVSYTFSTQQSSIFYDGFTYFWSIVATKGKQISVATSMFQFCVPVSQSIVTGAVGE